MMKFKSLKERRIERCSSVQLTLAFAMNIMKRYSREFDE
jgi:hypothetical protein